MLTMTKTKLKSLREEFTPKLAQEDMALAAGMRINSYRKAEQGKNVSYTTAMAVLRGVNNLRSQRGMPELKLEDLELSIV